MMIHVLHGLFEGVAAVLQAAEQAVQLLWRRRAGIGRLRQPHDIRRVARAEGDAANGLSKFLSFSVGCKLLPSRLVDTDRVQDLGELVSVFGLIDVLRVST